jgi:L-amino acid N-acyltransferase YncA
MNLRIRLATADDLVAIRDIYNYYVLHSTSTYVLEPETPEDRRQWFEKRGPHHPATVAELEDEIVGWGSLSPWNSRCGYSKTVEFSVYVRHDRHRRGVGRAIVLDLIERAKALGHHTLIGGASADQTASISLQEALGFERVARFRQVGRKFDRWLDVVYLQLMLDDDAKDS